MPWKVNWRQSITINHSAGPESLSSTTWAILTESHQGAKTLEPQHQQPNVQSHQKAEMPSAVDTSAVQEDDHLCSTAGWFAGAAGQLAGSRGSIGSVPQLDDNRHCQHESAGRMHELLASKLCHDTAAAALLSHGPVCACHFPYAWKYAV